LWQVVGASLGPIKVVRDIVLLPMLLTGFLEDFEEEESQWADRVLEQLNNAGGKQRIIQ
jgi:hypothetical protein